MLIPLLERKDILIGANKARPSIDLLGECRNDRLALKLESVQLAHSFHDLRNMKRLAGAPEYVMNHVDLRRTFPSGPRFARPRLQSPDSLKLGLQRYFDRVQYGGLDFIFFHRRYPPSQPVLCFNPEDIITYVRLAIE